MKSWRAQVVDPLAALAFLLASALLALAHEALAEPLVINANTSNPAPRAAWEAAVEAFEAEHPDIEVSFNVYDHESYKKSIRNWLTSASPDVVYWFVGNRMKPALPTARRPWYRPIAAVISPAGRTRSCSPQRSSRS